MRAGGPITATPAGIRLHLRVQPRASRDEVAGVAGDHIRVRLTAPPVDGAANEALVRFLADRSTSPDPPLPWSWATAAARKLRRW